jgi:hypothetical protein
MNSFAETQKHVFQDYVQGLASEVPSERTEAVDSLRKIPDLDTQLRTALKSEKPAEALLVIRTLKEISLTPDLIAISEKNPKTDPVMTLEVLYTSANAEKINSYCSEQMKSHVDVAAAGAVIACVNILGNAKISLPVNEAEKLLSHASYEVRIATAAYAGKLIAAGNHEDYLKVIEQSITKSPYQLRLEALKVASRLTAPQLQSMKVSLKSCLSDQNAEVKQACQRLNASVKGASK